ncbi:MarR family transcriptional regulator [uncultured Maritalea sp.]|jgi:DNA-binding MarR family transcriptional regulator|uniref:MarR family winged helix-turn-helix transcriptional regulator n=1 Tax=uncultured Maritalea sp. TaxID=757249 RepID=UPI00263025FC|nr:MarR family transcriptional regulator [uncultured Maritalea sp.]
MRKSEYRISELLDRLARLNQSELWTNDLNPAQVAALKYLMAANRFSRAPSHVADYLGATRGTVSQSLKTLAKKGLIEQIRSAEDKRSVRYDVTKTGHSVVAIRTNLDEALAQLDQNESANIALLLSNVLHSTLAARGGRSFGICKSCKHHDKSANRPYCRLLIVELAEEETSLICHEHDSAA